MRTQPRTSATASAGRSRALTLSFALVTFVTVAPGACGGEAAHDTIGDPNRATTSPATDENAEVASSGSSETVQSGLLDDPDPSLFGHGTIEGELEGDPFATSEIEGGYTERIWDAECTNYKAVFRGAVGRLQYIFQLNAWAPITVGAHVLQASRCNDRPELSVVSVFDLGTETYLIMNEYGQEVDISAFSIDIEAGEARVVGSVRDLVLEPLPEDNVFGAPQTLSAEFDVTLPYARQDVSDWPVLRLE